MAVLALEVSTSSAKAVIYSPEEDKILTVISHPYPKEISDTSTMNAEGIIHEIFALGRSALDGRTDIDMVVLSSIWYHSAVFVGSDDRPLGRLRTWADPSGDAVAAEYRSDAELYSRIYSLTGNPPHSIYALYKWMDMAKVYGMAISDVPHLMALPDYLYFRFTGKRMVSNATASASGLMNSRELKWDSSIIESVGIRYDQLSQIVEPEHMEPLASEAAASLGLPSGIPVLVPGADGACNQIAVGGLRPGIMSMSVGTSGALRLSSSEPIISKTENKNWCYYGAERRWIPGAATNGAGCCLDWFSRTFNTRLKDLDAELSPIYAGPMDAPIYLPFQFGERSPGWLVGRKGGWQDMTGSDSRVSLYFSVLEGVLFNMYQCYHLLTAEGAPEHILLSGGIVRSPVWLQMAADIFQKPMELNDVEHASILGALMICRKNMGYLGNLKDVPCNITKVIYPNDKADYSERFRRYLDWYERTK